MILKPISAPLLPTERIIWNPHWPVNRLLRQIKQAATQLYLVVSHHRIFLQTIFDLIVFLKPHAVPDHIGQHHSVSHDHQFQRTRRHTCNLCPARLQMGLCRIRLFMILLRHLHFVVVWITVWPLKRMYWHRLHTMIERSWYYYQVCCIGFRKKGLR